MKHFETNEQLTPEQLAALGELATKRPKSKEDLGHLDTDTANLKETTRRSNHTTPDAARQERRDAVLGHRMPVHDLVTTVFPEPNWIVPNLLPPGLTILAGKQKLGKSWLALQIAHAIASSGMIFGHRVAQGKILYLALEDPPRRIQERVAKQNWTPTDDQTADFYFLPEFLEYFGPLNKGGSELLADLIEHVGYNLAVIDTYSRAIQGDQNDVAVVTPALSIIQATSFRTECSVIVIDHHNKAAGGDPIGDVLGSTGKGAVADTIWGLYRERGSNNARLSVTGRDVVETTLDIEMAWEIGTWQAASNQGGSDPTNVQQEILDVLLELGPSTCTQIARAVGKDPSNTYKELQELCYKRLLRFHEETKKYLI